MIAGIFGAVDAEVDEQTTDLVLEAAAFSGPNVMRTSRDVGWRSEASTRFEKGLEPGYVPQGLTMASRLFAELCGGTVAPGVVDVRAAHVAEGGKSRRGAGYRRRMGCPAAGAAACCLPSGAL